MGGERENARKTESAIESERSGVGDATSCFVCANFTYPFLFEVRPCRGASLIRNRACLGTYSRTMPRALWWSLGGGSSHERGTPVLQNATSCSVAANFTVVCKLESVLLPTSHLPRRAFDFGVFRFRVRREQLKRVQRTFPEKWLKSRPKSGLDRVLCVEFARQRPPANVVQTACAGELGWILISQNALID